MCRAPPETRESAECAPCAQPGRSPAAAAGCPSRAIPLDVLAELLAEPREIRGRLFQLAGADGGLVRGLTDVLQSLCHLIEADLLLTGGRRDLLEGLDAGA